MLKVKHYTVIDNRGLKGMHINHCDLRNEKLSLEAAELFGRLCNLPGGCYLAEAAADGIGGSCDALLEELEKAGYISLA